MYGEFLLCAVGIYASYLSWGVLQERITSVEYQGAYFDSVIVLNTIQAATAALVGTLYLIIRRESFGPVNATILSKYLSVALLNSLASPFGYRALKYIDYPTMILGKSCKLVPVMAMSVLLHRRSFPVRQYFAVGLVTLGVSGFMLLHDQEKVSTERKSNSLFGLFLLSVNLVIDGITNSTQDNIFKSNKITGQQMLVMMNTLSTGLMVVYMLSPFSGNELSRAITFITTHPRIIYDILLFSICGAAGQVFIFHTLSKFGSLSLVTITVTRKMFSIILSVLTYNHYITLGQWASVAVVFSGIAIEAYSKKPKSKGKSKGSLTHKSSKQINIDSTSATTTSNKVGRGGKQRHITTQSLSNSDRDIDQKIM